MERNNALFTLFIETVSHMLLFDTDAAARHLSGCGSLRYTQGVHRHQAGSSRALARARQLKHCSAPWILLVYVWDPALLGLSWLSWPAVGCGVLALLVPFRAWDHKHQLPAQCKLVHQSLASVCMCPRVLILALSAQ
jgi:hypothetical protein